MLDLVIAGAFVVDGTGAPGFLGSVGIQDDRVTWIGLGADPPPEAGRTVEAAGRVLAPGFIDVHTHSDLGPLVDPWMPSTLRQGVTSVVVGNCGTSPWPPAGADEAAALVGGPSGAFRYDSFGAYLDALAAAGPAVNVAALVGHGGVRLEVMGLERRPPDEEELATMRRLVAEAVDDGAIGMSTGLIYVPGLYSATDEITALAHEVAARHGIYASHIRGEGEHLFRAVDEAIEIGRRAGLRTHVSHLKCESDLVWGRASELLERFHSGADVTGDQYPYAAWASVLWSLLPDWAPVGQLPSLLQDPVTRTRLASSVEDGEGDAFQSSVKGVGWDRIVIESGGDGRWNGKSIDAVGAELRVPPIEACFRLLEEDPDTACIGHAMHEDDVRTILADPTVMVASDGASMSPEGPLGSAAVHPRNYGTFPRVLGRYVRGGVLPLEAAIRKMTSLPADRFGLRHRGRVVEDAFADLVVFDPLTVTDEATFDEPHAYPSGIDVVVVNGRIAWDGTPAERAGRVLRRGT
ncbi:MAG: N-acyl-D-amino-acid deacylase family protein [Actinomycetota bacterium]